MRVLLSAYACEPNRGSEAEVGWQRALHMLPFADEVWVLTRANNRAAIEADPQSQSAGLHMIYSDPPQWALMLKRQSWFRPIFFALWQWGAYRVASRHHRNKPFDAVFHVTFASMQFGSFMGRLGTPFVIGPVGGGERAPLCLRQSMPLRNRATELLRDLGIVFQRCNPLARAAFRAATQIYVTTPESLRLVPRKWRAKTSVIPAIGTQGNLARKPERRNPDFPRFVYAGRLVYWKGAHLAIRALAIARKTSPSATITFVGSGQDERRLRDVAAQLGVAESVDFAGQLSRKQLADAFPTFTAMVFPSLHDSGGLVVLEALSEGLPVVCLDLGGPGIIVNNSCGIVVPTSHANEDRVVNDIAKAMASLGSISTEEFLRLSAGATARANELSWARLAQRVALCLPKVNS